MSVRKRVWRNADGSQGEAWAVSYTDQDGSRRLKSFKLKRDADAYHASVATDLRSGLHVPDATSITIAAASQLWLQSAAGRGLEPATLLQYRSRLTCHILPLLGAV